FGGGQEAGAKTCDREYGLANFSDRTHSSPRFHYFRFAIKALKKLYFWEAIFIYSKNSSA
ncbi:hypothetical protein, partial [Brucella tritici]|uniref:hypothetical protein n=1 Tax=Brucella tritici TaxID=94626 RepID=UPI003D6D5735